MDNGTLRTTDEDSQDFGITVAYGGVGGQWDGGSEPSIKDILRDHITRALMRSDRVGAKDLRGLMTTVRAALTARSTRTA